MSRKPSLREALDASLDRLAAGQSISQCLYPYPEHATELRPLLEVALALLTEPCPEARPEAVSAGYLRMMAAVRTRQVRLRRRQERRRAPRLFVMAGVVALVLVLIGLGWLWQAADLSFVLSSGLFSPVEAVVVEADGLVLHLPSDARTWRPVTAGQVLSAGDRLQTVGVGRARVAVGRSHAMALAGSAKVSLVAVPTRWQPRTSSLVYQMAGEVRYIVAGEGDAPTAGLGWGVMPALARPTDEAAAHPAVAHASAGPHFYVRSPVLAVRAARAAFVMAVAQDGATAVAVDEGEVTVTAGDRVQVTHAGETAVVSVADGADSAAPDGVGGDLQVLPGGSESLGEAGFGPADLSAVPGTPAGDAGGDDDLDPTDPGGVPDVPPGLEDRETPGVPPGQADKDDEPNTPPGLEDKEEPGVPPGQMDKDESTAPPGLEDRGGEPPGQVDDDSADGPAPPEAPPGLEDKGGEPPGQPPGDPGNDPGPPGSPPGQEDKDDSPPESPPGQEDKDNDPAPPGQDRGRGQNP